MEAIKNCGFLTRRVVSVSVSRIVPNPDQPRRVFDEDALAELTRSIRAHGILQPLTVRRVGAVYELIAGERRLRAAKAAGLREVPCLIRQSDGEESALLALIENLQREDLHWLEEAHAIARLIRVYGLSQEQAAEKLGKSQSAVANKLRLLRLSPACVALLQKGALTERHARALLRLEDEEARLDVLRRAVENRWNVAQTENAVESRLLAVSRTPPQRRVIWLTRDVRLFLNSLDRHVGMLNSAGVNVACEREDSDSELRIVIRIPRGEKDVVQ